MENLLDLLIGLALLYLLTAVAASFIVEFGASWTKLRASGLKHAITRLLHRSDAPSEDSNWTTRLYNHGLIQALHTPRVLLGDGVSAPSYIPSKTYASVLLDLIRKELKQADGQTLDVTALRTQFEAMAATLPKGLTEALSGAFSKGVASVEALEKELAAQFDAAMERASGWYKRATQSVLIVVALVLAVCFNLDTFYIAQRLLQDEALRNEVVGVAQRVNPGDGSRTLDEFSSALRVRAAILDKNVEAVIALEPAKDDAARGASRAALKRLQADNYYDLNQARLDYQLLTEADAAKRTTVFAELFTPSDRSDCPTPASAPVPAPKADEALCDWLHRIDGAQGAERDATILKFIDSGVPSGIRGRTLSPQLGRLLAAAIRAPDSKAPLDALQAHLKQQRDYARELDTALIKVRSLLPKVGWIRDVAHQIEFFPALFGWLATALMAGFGAPFWFDLLGKLVNLRSVGLKPSAAAGSGKQK